MMEQNWLLLAIAIFNVITAILTWRTHNLTLMVEKATNSMKDALVASTGEASHAAGLAEGKAAGEAKAAALAEGQLAHKE